MADRFKPCAVAGCNGNADRSAHGERGYCLKHYHRWRNHGDPEGGAAYRPKAEGPCSVEGCERPQYGHGMCNMHWQRWKKYGNTDGKQTSKGVPLRWLVDHLDYDGEECLIWPFSRDKKKGYGYLYFDKKVRRAHRVMARLTLGPPPFPEAEAAHECGKGHLGCVHPKHLRWSDRQSNIDDELRHGTRVRGEEKWSAKLSESDVRMIRLLGGSATQEQIGKWFGVTGRTIGQVIRGDTWAWLV